jgi:hypothetical protein
VGTYKKGGNSRVDRLTPVKQCPDCEEVKPLDEFPLNASRPDGRGYYCKACFAIRYRAHRERKAAEAGRPIKERRVVPEGHRWCPACASVKPLDEFPRNKGDRLGRGAYCKPCHNAKTRETYKRLYGSSREYHLRRRYGLTSAEVDAMIEAQGGTCAVCPGEAQHVDHDHETGLVRGILCFNCNQALGIARDVPKTLRALAAYLEVHRQPALRLVMDMGQWTGESPLEVHLREHMAS